jgi:hypothetical protein
MKGKHGISKFSECHKLHKETPASRDKGFEIFLTLFPGANCYDPL